MAIRTRYYGPTETQGTRIVANDGNGHRLTLHRDYAVDSSVDHKRAAVALAQRLGWGTDLIAGFYGGDLYWIEAPR